jgi:hypothetical protein
MVVLVAAAVLAAEAVVEILIMVLPIPVLVAAPVIAK